MIFKQEACIESLQLTYVPASMHTLHKHKHSRIFFFFIQNHATPIESAVYYNLKQPYLKKKKKQSSKISKSVGIE